MEVVDHYETEKQQCCPAFPAETLAAAADVVLVAAAGATAVAAAVAVAAAAAAATAAPVQEASRCSKRWHARGTMGMQQCRLLGC